MKHFAILIFICFFGLKAFSQNYIYWEESKPLDVNDFLGDVKESENFDAESFAEVTYSYSLNSFSNLSFEVHAQFNRNTSWIKKDGANEQLLRHEQLHFDIAELFARKIRLAFRDYQFTSDYAVEINN